MQTVLDLLARNAVAATVLAGVVILATTFVRRPAIRNALWLIVLIRFVMPPIWSVPVFRQAEAPFETNVVPPSISAPSVVEARIEQTATVEVLPQPRVASPAFVNNFHLTTDIV